MPCPAIAVACSTPALASQAAELACRLALPLARNGEHPSLLVCCTENGLELIRADAPHRSGAVRVDFTAGAAAFRRQNPGKELLLHACGCRKNARPAIIDATGGLGRDSFVLAAAGCAVQVFEREPVLAALLADGLSRARQHPATAAIAARITLQEGDAVAFLHSLQAEHEARAAVVYLDPMFPERRKAALVKKELQLLQLVAQHDPAGDAALLNAALAAACRVVIKRPAQAPFLAGSTPSFSLRGTSVRFDVHLCLSGEK